MVITNCTINSPPTRHRCMPGPRNWWWPVRRFMRKISTVEPNLPLDHVRTLLAVVDEGTFDAAAAALHITPSAVSQRIKALEQRTGRVLVQRTKPVKPTEPGEVVVRFARQLVRLQSDALEALGLLHEVENAALPIAVDADSLATWFLPALNQLPTKLGICIDLHQDDGARSTALLRKGVVLAAITSSPDIVQGCSISPLGKTRYLPVASLGLMDRWLTEWPKKRHLLSSIPVIFCDHNDDLPDRFVRMLTRQQGASLLRHYIPNSAAHVNAVIAGMGWGMLPKAQAEPLLQAGAIMLLNSNQFVDVPLYWQQWALDSPALTAIAEAVATAATYALEPP